MFSTSTPALPVVGLDLFSGHESFLKDLTEEDESLLVGGSRRSRERSRRQDRKSRRRSRRRRHSDTR